MAREIEDSYVTLQIANQCLISYRFDKQNIIIPNDVAANVVYNKNSVLIRNINKSNSYIIAYVGGNRNNEGKIEHNTNR